MTSTKLIKHHQSTVFAHMYEHMVCNQIKEKMYQQGLFKVVDFALDGIAFPSGLILIDMELYSHKAEQVFSCVPRQIVINEKTIRLALMQISAEEAAPVYMDADIDTLAKALGVLDGVEWQTVDEFDVLDQKGAKESHDFLYLAEGPQPKHKNMTLSVILDEQFATKHRELLPLFDQVAAMIAMTLQDQLSLRYGIYTKETMSRPGVIESLLSIHHSNKVEVGPQSVTDLHQEVMTDLNKQGAFDRLLHWLSSLSYETRWYEAPNMSRVLEDTGVSIGAAGWRRIATRENVKLLLSHTDCRVK